LCLIVLLSGHQYCQAEEDSYLHVSTQDSVFIEQMLDYFLTSAFDKGSSGCQLHPMYCHILWQYEAPKQFYLSDSNRVTALAKLRDSIVARWGFCQRDVCGLYELLRSDSHNKINLRGRLSMNNVPLEVSLSSNANDYHLCCRIVNGAKECEQAYDASDLFRCKFTSILSLLGLSCELERDDSNGKEETK